MRFCFVAADSPRERLLGEAIISGAKLHGDEAWVVAKNFDPAEILTENADVYGMVGVKSREIFQAVMKAGAHVLMFDKGYCRHIAPTGPRVWEYWRTCVDCQHPTAYLLDSDYSSDRFLSWGKEVKPWREDGAHILLAGSSEKYSAFHGLPHPTVWATKIAKILRKRGGGRKVVYRPKPSWNGAEPIDGTIYSGKDQSIQEAMVNAWCVVTHGSNAAVDAIIAGIPCIVLGDGVGRAISSTSLDDLGSPRLSEDRTRWLSALAYAQWTQAEMSSGQMWSHLRPRIVG